MRITIDGNAWLFEGKDRKYLVPADEETIGAFIRKIFLPQTRNAVKIPRQGVCTYD